MMLRYFLTEIKVEGFRGINNDSDPLHLRFPANAVNSIFAVNAIGKSSLFEALCYAIRGHVPKLQDLQAQEHPGDYYCNRFHSQNKARIDLEFEPDDGSSATIKICVERDAAGTRTVSSPSGHPDPEKFLSSLDEDFTLLDYTTFSRFIDDTPLQRGRSFSALLGLSAYSDMRQSLQTAADTRVLNNDLEIKTLSTSIKSAEESRKQALGSARVNYERVTGNPLEDVGKLDEYMGNAVTALSSVELLKPHFDGKSLSEVNFDELKEAIRTEEGGSKRKELERAIEAITKLEALGGPDGKAIDAELTTISNLIEERNGILETTRGDLFKRLYDAADKLIKVGMWQEDDKCPLCESSLTSSIKTHIDEQLEQYRDAVTKASDITAAWRDSSLALYLTKFETAEPLGISLDQRMSSRLTRHANTAGLTKEEVASAVQRLSEIQESARIKLNELRDSKEKIEKELPPSLVRLTEQVEYARQLKESVELYREKEGAEDIDRARLAMRERWKNFISRAAAVFSEAETELSTGRIAAIDSAYKSMFRQIMNLTDVVPDLQRATDREDLFLQLSDFHGQHGVSARALLSESYRNALAVSVFLAAALQHSGVPRFVVLDDVTSSFDAGHQFNILELIRRELQHPRNAQGLQFVILSHDSLLEKYFDRHANTTDWRHYKLQGSPPMGAIMTQMQDANRLKVAAENFLAAGQVTQAEPIIRQYLEYRLQQIIRKVAIPVPIDFAIKDHTRMVSNCLSAINSAIDINKKAGTLVLDQQQSQDLDTVHVPALVGNWVNHYETGSGSSLSAPMLRSVIQAIDDLAECFRFDDTSSGSVQRKWYKSLSTRT